MPLVSARAVSPAPFVFSVCCGLGSYKAAPGAIPGLFLCKGATKGFPTYRFGIRANQVISSKPLAATADWSEALRASVPLSTAAFAIFE